MGLATKEEPRLVEVTSIPVIYADGIGKVVVEGNNVRITYMEYRTFGNERVKMPVLEMVRPLASIRPGEIMTLVRAFVGMDGSEVAH